MVDLWKCKSRRFQDSSSRRPGADVLAVTSYAILALVANLPAWPGSEGSLRGGDLDFLTWSLEWTAFALLHHLNLFYTTWLNYPVGVNLAQNTLMPLLGIFTLPLTVLQGPIASLNFLLWLAFCSSAASMYLVLTKWTNRRYSAYLGGLIYGFSPYMVGQGLGHLVQNFVPLPPLILYAFWKLLVEENCPKIRWGVAIGLMLVAQLWISPEIALTSIIIVSVSAIVLGLSNLSVALGRFKRALPGLTTIVAVMCVPAIYYAVALLTGPQHAVGPSLGGGLSADLLGPLLPTSSQRFGGFGLVAYGNRLVSEDFPENGSYLGAPLLLLLVWTALRQRRRQRPWIVFTLTMAALVFVLSLGGRLTVLGHVTLFPLPAAVFSYLPVLKNLAEVRLSLYVDFFVACTVALVVDEVDFAEIALAIKSRRISSRNLTAHLLVLLLSLTAVATWVPAWPYPYAAANVPAVFSGKTLNAIRKGSVVLISPYPSVAEVQPEVWQAVSRMRFRLIGGYAVFRGPTGLSDPYPAFLKPLDVMSFLWTSATGGPSFPDPRAPRLGQLLEHNLCVFLRRYHVDAVIVTPVGTFPTKVAQLFDRTLGAPSKQVDSVSIWYQVPLRLGHCHY